MSGGVGVVLAGAGFVSILHALALRAVGGARVVAVASQSRRGAEHRAHVLGAEAHRFEALPALVGRPDVDLVLVLGPNALHREHALAAIEAGKAVVVEKPLATRLDDARAIAAAAAARGVFLGYAENQVFSPVLVRAREEIASGAVGPVRRVVGFCGHAGPPAGSWFWQPALAGGGAGFDMGSHTVEASRFLAGGALVDGVSRAELEMHASGVDGRCAATLVTADGVRLEVTSSFVESAESMRFDVHGDAGTLHVVFAPAPHAQRIVLERPGREAVDVPVPHARERLRIDRWVGSMGYVDQLAHFLRALSQGSPPREGGAEGVHVAAVLSAIYWAAGRKEAVRVADVPGHRSPLELWQTP